MRCWRRAFRAQRPRVARTGVGTCSRGTTQRDEHSAWRAGQMQPHRHGDHAFRCSSRRRRRPQLSTRAVCNACAKEKCAVCSGMRRNYSLLVDQCCQLHHRPDDGLRVQCCREHRLTRCGTCPNAEVCCALGHHGNGAGGVDDGASTSDNRRRRRKRAAPSTPSTSPSPVVRVRRRRQQNRSAAAMSSSASGAEGEPRRREQHVRIERPRKRGRASSSEDTTAPSSGHALRRLQPIRAAPGTTFNHARRQRRRHNPATQARPLSAIESSPRQPNAPTATAVQPTNTTRSRKRSRVSSSGATNSNCEHIPEQRLRPTREARPRKRGKSDPSGVT